ncbi:MAG TPA: DegQ family serine endoprotease [Burkholderiales bacterium]|nr:DegQ family serine endoprotease [Burkholderiales bacterium]
MQATRLKPSVIALAIAAALAAGCSDVKMPGVKDAGAAPAPATTAAPMRQLPDFSALVEQQGPAVVNISVTKEAAATAVLGDGFGDEEMRDFLRRFGMPMPKGQPMPDRGMPAQGVGSGFIVSPDGMILTNAHVVDGATEVLVRLADKREFKAKVLGTDAKTDIAVIKIDATGLPAVRIGDTSKLRVGEWVAAIGSPFGLEHTVTAGIVSAKSRNLPDERLVPFIQTDVAVNPGNSGGPLFNMAGEVVGINSQIFSTSGGYMGLSFAIPIDLAMKVKDQLVAHGKVTRGRIGVAVQQVTQPLADSFGLGKARGALVANVEPGAPAAKAGLQTGDVIVAFNGKPIAESGELPTIVADVKPGDTVTARVWRNGAERDVRITVAEMPAENAKLASAQVAPHGKLGVAVRPLSADEAKRIQSEGGLLVERAEGPAAKAGVRPGDVILGVNGKPVKSIDELKSAVDAAGKNAAVLVQRGDNRIFVPVQMG